jgi:hypothetical protein
MTRPTCMHDLSVSERRFALAMTELGFGRFEFLRIERGELILRPWPATVRHVKFSAAQTAKPKDRSADFEVKKQVADFFEYARSVEAGEIRTLEVQDGLPFSMEVEHSPGPSGGQHHA